MMFRHLTITLLAYLGCTSFAFAAAELQVDKGTFNFGTIAQGNKVQHAFTIKNIGDEPLQIKKLEAACGCTAVKPSTSVLKPGQGAKIAITFDSAGFSGKVKKVVVMTTNAAKTPQYTFAMAGTVSEEVEVTPRQVNLGPLKRGVAKNASVTVANNGKDTLKLIAVNVTSTSLQIKPTITTAEIKAGAKGTIELEVTAKPEAKILSGYLHIQTSSAEKKEITVPVYASLGE